MGNYACYATLADLTAALPGSGTADDAALLHQLETVSRWIEGKCSRHFSVRSESRIFTAARCSHLLIDDILAVSSIETDEDGDGVYEVTWQATDYLLDPPNSYPRTKVIMSPNGAHSFPVYPQAVRITGLWGYGDGETATPYEPSGATVTVADESATTVTVSDQSLLAVGQVVLVGTEQMYVRGLTDGGLGADSATVYRGINGTTAAAHAADAASIYHYPDKVRDACVLRALQLWMLRQGPMGQIAGGEFAVSTSTVPYAVILDLLDEYRRIEVA